MIQGLGAQCAVNTPPWLYRINLLMLYKAKITVGSEICTKQHVEF
jgi:hypothetical protein